MNDEMRACVVKDGRRITGSWLKPTLIVVGFTLLLLAAATAAIWQPLLASNAHLPVASPAGVHAVR
jgi:hypothetical protein